MEKWLGQNSCVFDSKYHKYMFFKSSSTWYGIKDANDALLENTFWTLGKGDYINLWNYCWCSDIFISKLDRIPYFDRVSLYFIVSLA